MIGAGWAGAATAVALPPVRRIIRHTVPGRRGAGSSVRAVIGVLVIASCIVLVALAVLGLATTALNRPPDRQHRLGVAVCEVLLVIQAAIAAFRVLAGGVTLPEQSTFLIYLVVSVCVLPIALQFATAGSNQAVGGAAGEQAEPAEPPSRWGGAVIAVGAIGTLVAVLRLQGLWAAGGA